MLPFFEHANIAEEQAMATLKSQLVVKALTTIQGLLHELPRLHLRFACAIDESCCGSPLLCPAPADGLIRELMRHAIANEPALADLRGALSPRLRMDGEAWREGVYASCGLPDLINRYYAHVADRRADHLSPAAAETSGTNGSGKADRVPA
jgi:hypothetical protein